MKKSVIISLIFLLGISATSLSQSANGLTYDDGKDKTNDTIEAYFFKPGKVDVSMSMGMSVASTTGSGAFVGSYVSPFVAYNVSKRFRLKVGAAIYNNMAGLYYNPYEPYGAYTYRPVTFSRIMVGGDYLLNEKVTLSGMVYKDINPFVAASGDRDLNLNEGEGFMFNLNYRPSENFEINIGVDYSRGYNPYRYQSPFHQPSMFNPYPGYGGW